MVLQAVARCSLSLPTATTARQPNSASQGGSSQTEWLSRGLFFFSPLSSLSSSLPSYYNPEKYHRREFWAVGWRSREGVWFHFQLLHNTVRDWNFCRFTLLHKHICRDRRLFCSSTNHHGYCVGGPWNRSINSATFIADGLRLLLIFGKWEVLSFFLQLKLDKFWKS